MTCNGRIGGSGFGNNLFNPITSGTTKKAGNVGETNTVNNPVQITGTNTTTRADLDTLSPYAALGVDIKAPKDSVDVAAKAAPEFGGFKGNFTLKDTVSANYSLADWNLALHTGSESMLNMYVNTHTDRVLVEKHLQNGGFANFLEQLDIAVS
ncbi:hypothetical protein IJ472_00310 [bacterium]|nr:hypothetical protein [bacterium]